MAGNFENIIKLATPTPAPMAAPATQAQQVSVAPAVQRAQTTEVDTSASVFASGGSSANKASTTVIVSDDYTSENTDSMHKEVWITNDAAPTMDRLLERAYGWSETRDMSEGEKNSAMWSIVDNNRWMVNNINQTYIASQVVDDVASQLNLDLTNEDVQEQVENIIADVFDNGADLSSYDEATRNAILAAKSKIDINENGSVSAKKGVEGAYQTFDPNVRTDQIPPEMIEATG